MADTHRDVESVVQNVVNSPQFRSLIADVIESSNHTTNLTQTTSSNISQSQTISANAQVASTSTTTPTASTSNLSRTTYANPVAEFNAIFRRGASTSQQQQGGGTVASFLPAWDSSLYSKIKISKHQYYQNVTSPPDFKCFICPVKAKGK
jgi:hypothetical protein